jgi:ribosomal protein S18 acetylase RimI-like enzyme
MMVRPYLEADEEAVVALWRACALVVPSNDPFEDIRRKLAVQRDLFLVGTLDGRVVATVMAGYDGHRGWINYLAVAPDHRRRGLGGLLMAAAERALAARGCPKINLQVRAGNERVVAFYERLGFTVEPRISLGKHL